MFFLLDVQKGRKLQLNLPLLFVHHCHPDFSSLLLNVIILCAANYKILILKHTKCWCFSLIDCRSDRKAFFYKPNSFPPKLMSGNEILKFIADDFTQVENPEPNDVFVIWNSSDVKLSPDKLDTHFLATIPTGFPFGLIVEHSGILLADGLVFQKASPKEIDKFETVQPETAFAPYEKLGYQTKNIKMVKKI